MSVHTGREGGREGGNAGGSEKGRKSKLACRTRDGYKIKHTAPRDPNMSEKSFPAADEANKVAATVTHREESRSIQKDVVL